MALTDEGLSLEVVYKDEHLLQVTVRVDTKRWRGTTSVYTSGPNLMLFAWALDEFGVALTGSEPHFEGTAQDALASLHFRRVHVAGDLTCAVELRWHATRMEIVLPVEAAAFDRFRAELRALASSEAGVATLRIDPHSMR